MATFDWRQAATDIEFRIKGWDLNGGDFVPLEGVEVVNDPLWHLTVLFHADSNLFEEDPREHDEVGRANMRSLLRHLKYTPVTHWSWKR